MLSHIQDYIMDPNFFVISKNFTNPTIVVAITVTSFVIEVATIFHVLIVLKLFKSVSVVHQNMKIVCYNMWIGVILKSLVNIISAIQYLFHVKPFESVISSVVYNVTHDMPNMLIYFLPIAIVCERVCATIYADKYEHWFNMPFIVVLCGTPWLIAVWLTVHLLFLQQYFTILYSYFFFDAVTLGMYAVYFIVYFCTRNSNTFGTLSERYQRFENRVAYRTVTPIAITSAATFLATVVHNVVLNNLNYWFPEHSLHDKVALNRLLLDTIVAAFVFTFPYHFVFLHATMRRRYIKCMFCWCLKSSDNNPITSQSVIMQVKSVSGQNLILPNETAYYFQTLEKQWNATHNRRK